MKTYDSKYQWCALSFLCRVFTEYSVEPLTRGFDELLEYSVEYSKIRASKFDTIVTTTLTADLPIWVSKQSEKIRIEISQNEHLNHIDNENHHPYLQNTCYFINKHILYTNTKMKQ